MNQFIDITHRKELRNLLLTLRPDTKPLWGKMKSRQMIEHLVEEMQWINGKKIAACQKPAREAEIFKQRMVYSDAEIPKNVFIKELPGNYSYPGLETAINELMKELDDF